MNVAPVHQLAVALQSSPKLFACFLGSGISRAAGIPTGWQIVCELVEQHAEQLGQSAAAHADPAGWYAAKYGGAPDYSEVVAMLAPTTDLRRGLLERYFTVLDAVTGERREHEPTAAHRAIAKLVQKGYLRVIVTTNFDRLMENALREAGVTQVEVVASPEEAANCYPFHAAQAFVFKVHGDWRDTRLRNSSEELATYPDAFNQLLARIAGEHGLVVCGWSATYDVALRAAITAHNRRFPAFWVDPKLNDASQALVAHLHASHVAASGDQFFSELELAVAALERQRPPAPLAAEVLVARARRFIADEREMELDDLVSDATRALCTWIEKEFDPAAGAPASGSELHAHSRSVATVCEAHVEPLARLLTVLARYSQPSYLAQRSLSALLRSAQTRIDASVPPAPLSWFHGYPAVLCAFAWGVACGVKDNWRGAISAVRDAGSGSASNELQFPPADQEWFASALHSSEGMPPRLLFANRLAAWLFPHLEDWTPRRTDFARAFDRFDLLMAVFSTRWNFAQWKPRCAMARWPIDGDDAARTTFSDTAESWLLHSIGNSQPTAEDDELRGAFQGSRLASGDVFGPIRAWEES